MSGTWNCSGYSWKRHGQPHRSAAQCCHDAAAHGAARLCQEDRSRLLWHHPRQKGKQLFEIFRSCCCFWHHTALCIHVCLCCFSSRSWQKTWEETPSAQNSQQQYVKEYKIWTNVVLMASWDYCQGLDHSSACHFILYLHILTKKQYMYLYKKKKKRLKNFSSWRFYFSFCKHRALS